MGSIHVDEDRLWDSLQSLGRIGAQDDGSVVRVTGSEADGRARDRVVEWFEAEGLSVRVDPVGNIVARRPGRTSLPPVVTGSHLDTVPNGGRFDGAAGVLAPLEIVRAWNEADLDTERPVEIVVFTEEEGTRFDTGLLGSAVATGRIAVEEALAFEDDDGRSLERVLEAIGYRGSDDLGLGDAAAFVELHVEQGPHLDDTGTDVGVVEHVTGIFHGAVTYTGEANHAGTTAMARRRDAFTGAAEVALALERRARERARESDAVGTVGRVAVEPGGVNVIPERVRFSLDIRDTDEPTRRSLVEETLDTVRDVARERNLKVEIEEHADVAATPMDDSIVDVLAASGEDCDVTVDRMVSGAAHDAMNVATVAPAAMLFVPSRDGISHSPEEYTSPEELANGTRVLERSLRTLATKR